MNKWANEMNRQISKDEINMLNKYYEKLLDLTSHLRNSSQSYPECQSLSKQLTNVGVLFPETVVEIEQVLTTNF